MYINSVIEWQCSFTCPQARPSVSNSKRTALIRDTSVRFCPIMPSFWNNPHPGITHPHNPHQDNPRPDITHPHNPHRDNPHPDITNPADTSNRRLTKFRCICHGSADIVIRTVYMGDSSIKKAQVNTFCRTIDSCFCIEIPKVMFNI